MVVDAFTYDAGASPAGNGAIDVPVQVGAKLTVGNTQNDGLYTGTFDVTVDYQ